MNAHDQQRARLLQELAEARAEVTKLGHITLGLGQEKVRLLAEVERLAKENCDLAGVQSMHDLCISELALAAGIDGRAAPADIREQIRSLRAQLTTLRAQADAMAGAMKRADVAMSKACGFIERYETSHPDEQDRRHAGSANAEIRSTLAVLRPALFDYHATAKPTQSSQNEP